MGSRCEPLQESNITCSVLVVDIVFPSSHISAGKVFDSKKCAYYLFATSYTRSLPLHGLFRLYDSFFLGRNCRQPFRFVLLFLKETVAAGESTLLDKETPLK